MTYRALALLPVLLALVVAATAVAVEPASLQMTLLVAIEVVKVLALIGCATAAATFEPGDYLRRAWTLNGGCFVFLLVRDLTLFASVRAHFPLPLDTSRAVLVLAANACSVAGTWWMARAGHIAGLELPGTVMTRRAALGAGALVALLITGAPLAADTVTLVGGDVKALVPIASDLGDIGSLCMLAPVLWTAFAVRGGLLAWPWGLFAASLFAWLLYDAAAAAHHFFVVPAAAQKIVSDVLRTVACAYIFSAGMAQRIAVRG